MTSQEERASAPAFLRSLCFGPARGVVGASVGGPRTRAHARDGRRELECAEPRDGSGGDRPGGRPGLHADLALHGRPHLRAPGRPGSDRRPVAPAGRARRLRWHLIAVLD